MFQPFSANREDAVSSGGMGLTFKLQHNWKIKKLSVDALEEVSPITVLLALLRLVLLLYLQLYSWFDWPC